MRYVFRKPAAQGRTDSQPGEFHIESASGGMQRRALAELVLRSDPAAMWGDRTEPIDCLVLPADPTLDDMLAALIAERMLTGGPVPDGMARFAHYAALVREGLRPAEFPLKASLEGVYLAILSTAGEDLTGRRDRPPVLGWLVAFGCRGLASGRSRNRSRSCPVAAWRTTADFVRERAFLARDQEVYRQDVARGERWIVSLPDGPPTASGLVLRRPRSILWKFWSRQDRDAPTGDAYLLLGVDWGEGNWVFSTDPVHRMSLKPLADLLDQGERSAKSDAARGPWFDGKPFDHTLIAAPRGGTTLSDKQVLRIVKRWTRACPARSAVSRRRLLSAIAAAAMVLLMLGFSLTGYLTKPETTARGPAIESGERESSEDNANRGLRRVDPDPQQASIGRRLIVAVGINEYQHWQKLRNAVHDATSVSDRLCQHHGFGAFEEPLLDQAATKSAIESLVQDRLRAVLQPEDSLVFYFAGHGTTRDDQVGDAVIETGFLIPVEASHDREQRWSEYVELDSLLKELSKLRARHVLVILDSCHSGIALGKSASTYRSSERYHADLARRVSRKVISSARGDKVALDGGSGSAHSLFTDRLLAGLRDAASDLDGDGIFTSSELGLFLQQTVGQASQSRQTPDYGAFYNDDRGELIIPVRQTAAPENSEPAASAHTDTDTPGTETGANP
jgi:hypothetical protein